MKKLEKQVETVESERNALTKSLKEIQDQVEKGKGQVSTLQAAVATIVSHIDALHSIKTRTSQRLESTLAEPKVCHPLIGISSKVISVSNQPILIDDYRIRSTKAGSKFQLKNWMT